MSQKFLASMNQKVMAFLSLVVVVAIIFFATNTQLFQGRFNASSNERQLIADCQAFLAVLDNKTFDRFAKESYVNQSAYGFGPKYTSRVTTKIASEVGSGEPTEVTSEVPSLVPSELASLVVSEEGVSEVASVVVSQVSSEVTSEVGSEGVSEVTSTVTSTVAKYDKVKRYCENLLKKHGLL